MYLGVSGVCGSHVVAWFAWSLPTAVTTVSAGRNAGSRAKSEGACGAFVPEHAYTLSSFSLLAAKISVTAHQIAPADCARSWWLMFGSCFMSWSLKMLAGQAAPYGGQGAAFREWRAALFLGGSVDGPLCLITKLDLDRVPRQGLL